MIVKNNPREALSWCRLCEAGCGVRVEVDDRGIATSVSPDREHVVTRGFFCIKGHALVELLEDPRRIVQSMVRLPGAAPGAFVPLDYNAAIDQIAGKIINIARESGPDSIAFYHGNPAAFSWAAAVSNASLARIIGSGRFYTAGTIDCAERFALAEHCYGHPLLVTIPDIQHAKFILLLGANPAVSTWAQLTSAPRWREDVASMRRAGGAFVVVDPRRTETAALADRYIPIRPSTDADLLLAMVRIITDRKLEHRAFLQKHTRGFEAALATLAPYTLERASLRTGIPAGDIVRLAVEFATAPSGFAVGHSGLTMQSRGSLAEWAVILLNAACGRIDAPGGLLFNPGLLNLTKLGDRLLDRGAPLPAGEPPGTRRILDDLPCAGLAPAIESGRVRALISLAGNPAVTFPNAPRIARAMQKLELYAAIDPYINESTQYAHYLLPPTSMLEREDCVLLNSSFLTIPYTQWTPPVSTPPPGVRTEWWISHEIARRIPALPFREPGASLFRKLHFLRQRWMSRWILRLGPRRALQLMLLLYGEVGLATIRKHPHGLLLKRVAPGELLKRLRTPSGVIELFPQALHGLARHDEDHMSRLESSDGRFYLISTRRKGGMNTWLNHLASARRVDSSPTVSIHPADAATLNITDGRTVMITNETGSFEALASLSDNMARGVVAATHGFPVESLRGHFNHVTSDRDLDPLTGMPAFNGTRVSVRAAPER